MRIELVRPPAVLVMAALVTCALVPVAACGGGAPAPDPAPRPDTVTVADPDPEVDVEAVPEPDPTPTGPVQVTVTARVGTGDASAQVKLLGAGGEVAAEGETGTAFTVPSGTYTVEARITDARVMIDTPTTLLEDVELAPGEPRTVEVRFPVARVRLAVTRGGRRLGRGRVTLYRQGSEDVVATFDLGNDFVPVTPGRYEADVTAGSTQTRVRGLTFMEGAQMTIPVQAQ